MAGVPAVGAAIAVALSAARRRMYERKEDTWSASGGAVVVGTEPVSTSMSMSAAEAAATLAPAAVYTVTSRGKEAARVAEADAVGTVVSSAVSEGIRGKRGAKLPPVPALWWEAAARGGPAPRGDALAGERGRPFKTEVARTL